MKNIIDALKRDIAVTFPFADVKALSFVDSMLVNQNFPPIPKEYKDFLALTDGLIWNGIELYGTKSYERELNGYSLPGIIDINSDFVGFDALENKLIVGRMAEDLIVYSATDNLWQCIDRTDFMVMQVAPYLQELVYSFVEGTC